MGIFCFVDSIEGKMGLVREQNVTIHMGVTINPTAQFQLATHVRGFKILYALDVIQIHSMCNVRQTLRIEVSISGLNPLKPELNPICYLLALLGAHHFLHVSRIRVKLLTFRLLMS